MENGEKKLKKKRGCFTRFLLGLGRLLIIVLALVVEFVYIVPDNVSYVLNNKDTIIDKITGRGPLYDDSLGYINQIKGYEDKDFDDDGLNNGKEVELGTNPFNDDTDNDGLKDGEEVTKYESNPLLYSTANDEVSDGAKVMEGLDINVKTNGKLSEENKRKVGDIELVTKDLNSKYFAAVRDYDYKNILLNSYITNETGKPKEIIGFKGQINIPGTKDTTIYKYNTKNGKIEKLKSSFDNKTNTVTFENKGDRLVYFPCTNTVNGIDNSSLRTVYSIKVIPPNFYKYVFGNEDINIFIEFLLLLSGDKEGYENYTQAKEEFKTLADIPIIESLYIEDNFIFDRTVVDKGQYTTGNREITVSKAPSIVIKEIVKATYNLKALISEKLISLFGEDLEFMPWLQEIPNGITLSKMYITDEELEKYLNGENWSGTVVTPDGPDETDIINDDEIDEQSTIVAASKYEPTVNGVSFRNYSEVRSTGGSCAGYALLEMEFYNRDVPFIRNFSINDQFNLLQREAFKLLDIGNIEDFNYNLTHENFNFVENTRPNLYSYNISDDSKNMMYSGNGSFNARDLPGTDGNMVDAITTNWALWNYYNSAAMNALEPGKDNWKNFEALINYINTDRVAVVNMSRPESGHAVVGYKIKKSVHDSNKYFLYIDDNNYPGGIKGGKPILVEVNKYVKTYVGFIDSDKFTFEYGHYLNTGDSEGTIQFTNSRVMVIKD